MGSHPRPRGSGRLRVHDRDECLAESGTPSGSRRPEATHVFPIDDSIATAECRVDVVRALAKLTARQRAAVVLTDLVGLTSEEAGRALGIRPSTVRVLAARARSVLKEGM